MRVRQCGMMVQLPCASAARRLQWRPCCTRLLFLLAQPKMSWRSLHFTSQYSR